MAVADLSTIPPAPAAPPAVDGEPVAAPLPPTLSIRPLADPVIDAHGFDARSDYAERFWLGVIGPSTLWFLRRVAAGLDRAPAGFEIDVAATARALGIGTDRTVGRSSIFARTIERSVKFGMAQRDPDGTLAVRRRLPPLAGRHVQRLPEFLQAEHARWQNEQLHVTPGEAIRRRARRLALTLFELGEGREEVEHQLHRWRFHPALAYEAAAWAWAQHLEAANAR